MFAKLSRAALTVVAATAAFASVASADSIVVPTAPTAPARVEYQHYGQGSYVVVAVPTENAPPYALTGRQRDTDYWNRQNVQVINAGQGRYILVPTR